MNYEFQFLGIKWIDGFPKIMIAADNSKVDFFDIPHAMNFTKIDVKKCVGYYDLEKREYRSCPDDIDLSNSEYAQYTTNYRPCQICNRGTVDNRKPWKIASYKYKNTDWL